MPYRPGKSFKDANKKLNSIEKLAVSKVKRGVYVMATSIGAYAKIETPVDTSNLINSQYIQTSSAGTQVIATIGYTANYAAPVHDPNVPMKFKKASAEKLFLTSQYSKHKKELDDQFRRDLKI